MKKKILLTASFLGAISVLIGAMGAHFFEDYLMSADSDQTFEIAVRYQFYHIFLLFILGGVSNFLEKKLVKYGFVCCVAGILFFSGSLYLLCITNNVIFGMITPMGGVLLALSWLLLFYAIFKSKNI